MKRWAFLTIVLYVVLLTIVIVPLFLIATAQGEQLNLLKGFYALFVPVLILIQFSLLLLPTNIVSGKPIARRRILFSAIIGAIPMAALALGFFGSIALIIWGEIHHNEQIYGWSMVAIPALFWCIWAIIFYRNYSDTNTKAMIPTVVRWLMRASILELIVAIPSHIIARQRDECCAPHFTLLAIATGLSIALASFGPGIFFLFIKKVKEKKTRRVACEE